MISLVHDTIDKKEIIKWLKKNPQLTKGPLTIEFEKEFAKFIGVKYSVMVNSGSSANLATIYALKISNSLKNNKIIVPALCWSTTISPIIQFGLEPIIADIDLTNLCINTNQLEEIFKNESPAALFLVHPLGFMPDMDKIQNLCKKYDVILLEDSCETVGSTWNGKQAGNFGLMSTFSFYFSHHITAIEGGMICTNDKSFYNLLLMIRSHGWTRDLNDENKKKFRDTYNIDEFNEQFTFYVPAFNIRATDLQAKIGLSQLKNLTKYIQIRQNNFEIYQENLTNKFWKINPILGNIYDTISNFSYPVIHSKRNEIIEILKKNKIECRPLICGNIAKQPAFKNCKSYPTPNADLVHENGLYVPNHTGLNQKDISKICRILNSITSK